MKSLPPSDRECLGDKISEGVCCGVCRCMTKLGVAEYTNCQEGLNYSSLSISFPTVITVIDSNKSYAGIEHPTIQHAKV